MSDDLVYECWACSFCGESYAEKQTAIDHARKCTFNPAMRTCDTCKYCVIVHENDNDITRICKHNQQKWDDVWVENCPNWEDIDEKYKVTP